MFVLIDLVSQANAVQRLLVGLADDEKIRWLRRHGDVDEIPNLPHGYPRHYSFVTPVGKECAFFLRGDEFVFLGDHSTFVARE
ncbi:MAG: hypothetical protein KDC35_17350 [Acidobacteria bacterium]|nr:hypothetical protein [Acidobacteriota bacterium]